MIELHYYPGNASLAPHILLHEIGVPFSRVLVDRTQQAHKTPAYLGLNPNRLIPVLRDGPRVLYECVAIGLHLCNTHPAASLAHAQARVGGLLDQLDAQLASHGQPWLLGADYSAADAFALMFCRWTRGFDGAPGSPLAPARDRPQLGPYLQSVLARPAVQRALAAEGLTAPWV